MIRFSGLFVLIAALLAVVIAGCGSSSTARITRVGAPLTTQRTDGELVHAPAPLTAAAIDHLVPGSAEEAVMTVWFYGQWGAAPSIYEMYDSYIRHEVTAGVLTSVYAAQRDTMLASLPRLGTVRTTRLGTIVTVELLSASAAPRYESYLLRKSAGAWAIVYDSFFDTALLSYVETQVQDKIDPAATSPSPRAVAAGEAAAKAFRIGFIHGQPNPLR
jgi:hypothetical protein